MIKKNCKTCRKNFWVKPYKRETTKYCSWKCRKRGKYIKCAICGKLFYIYEYQFDKKKICSRKCRKTGKYISCKQCGKISYIKKHKLRKNNYCSKRCFQKSRIGKKYSIEINKKKGRLGKKSWRWKDGRKIDKSNYILIYISKHPFVKSRYIREHRFIVEKQIGRYLLPQEQVHHINEIKDDNRIENLMAFVNNSAHRRFHNNPQNIKSEEIVFDGRQLQ